MADPLRSFALKSAPDSGPTLQAFIQACPLAVYAVDTSGWVKLWNHAAEKLFGWSEEEVLDQPIPLVQPEKIPEALSILQVALKGPVSGFEVRRKRKDGSPIDLSTSIAPLIGPNGEAIGVLVVAEDISARKQLQFQAQQETEFARSLIESSFDPIMAIDREFVVTCFNGAAERFTGLSRRNVIGRSAFSASSHLISTDFQKSMSRVFEGHSFAASGKLYLHPTTGRKIPYESRYSPIRDAHGLVTGAVILIRELDEVTEDFRVRESEFNYRLLFDKNPNPMFVYRKSDFRFLSVNEAALKSYGYSRDEFLKMTAIDIRPEEEVERFLNTVKAVSPELEKLYAKHQAKDGRVFDVEIVPEDINFHGEAARLVVARDVTEEVQARLKHQTDRDAAAIAFSALEALVACAPVGLALFDHDFRYLRINETLAQINGISVDTHLGKTARDVIPFLADYLEEKLKQVLSTGVSIINNELYLPKARRTGQPGYWLASYFPVYCQSGRILGVGTTLVDVTQQKNVENAFRENSQLSEQFVALLTHDLRTPMTVAKASAELIQRRIERTDMVHTLARQVIQSIERADQMILDLLDANRIRAGEMLPLALAECQLDSMLEELQVDIKTLYGIELRLEQEKGIIAYWSKRDVRRALENLVSNAIKYGTPGKPISVGAITDEKHVSLWVHNFGKPISELEQKKLFQPFQRTREAECSGKRGWGLGLTLVHGVIQAHGGKVEISSNEKDGTHFRLTLPLRCTGSLLR